MTREKKKWQNKDEKKWYCIFNLENVDCFFHIKCTVIENTFYNQNVYQRIYKEKSNTVLGEKRFPRDGNKVYQSLMLQNLLVLNLFK